MNRHPLQRKSIREYVKGLGFWGKIGWTILLGYIAGRILYFLYHFVAS